MVDTFDPQVVIVLVGANDLWTAPVAIDPAQEPRGSIMAFVSRHSRAFKLFDMVRRAFDSRELEVTFDPPSPKAQTGMARYGDREFSLGYVMITQPFEERPATGLARNLRAIVRQTRDSGAELILMTYASGWGPYGVANTVIEGVARETGTPFIDLAAAFAGRCPPCSRRGMPSYLCLKPKSCADVCASRDSCTDFLFEDHHPTARGYRLVAEAIVAHLRED
jgi:lysophospholipase L1-like esterase